MTAAGGLALLVRRSLRQHALATLVTAVSVALGCGLTMAVFGLSRQAREAFVARPEGFDAVLGARGSPLQLVLNAVFHLEDSPGNLPWALYEEIRDDPGVTRAVPLAVGDSYRGFRVVGTTSEVFDALARDGAALRVRPPGRLFDPTARQAVIGSLVAQETGLRYNDPFHPAHGTVERGSEHADEYFVAGVLEPTNTPADRVIWIPIEGVWRMSGHVLRGAGEEFVPSPHEDVPPEHREVSAVLVRTRDPMSGLRLEAMFNKERKDATFVWPVDAVVADLFDKLGWSARALAVVAWMVVLVAAGGILAAIYNSIRERRREFAILRAIGARRSTVFAAVVLEAAAIAALGAVGGYGVYAAVLGGAAAVVRAEAGVVLDVTAFHPALVAVPAAMVALGALAGVLPAWKAYATDVATHLAPET